MSSIGMERDMVEAAISEGLPLTIGYVDVKGRITTRVVEPLFSDDYSFLAKCRHRDDYRRFLYSRLTFVEEAE